jgi:hypothetical protein
MVHHSDEFTAARDNPVQLRGQMLAVGGPVPIGHRGFEIDLEMISRLSDITQPLRSVSSLRCERIGDTIAWQRYCFSGTPVRERCRSYGCSQLQRFGSRL